MTDFIYEKPFQIGKDLTKYRLLTQDYVHVIEVGQPNNKGSRKILQIDPKALELLAEEAIQDVSFYLRTAHLEKLKLILDDPQSSDNDKYVAYAMLQNTVISAKGELPWCQDTGTAIVIGKKGEQVWTGVNDAEYISKGIYTTYKNKNLRYSK